MDVCQERNVDRGSRTENQENLKTYKTDAHICHVVFLNLKKNTVVVYRTSGI
jgi:hypothetical protein